MEQIFRASKFKYAFSPMISLDLYGLEILCYIDGNL